jgi:SAM-dependent methyltransferase
MSRNMARRFAPSTARNRNPILNIVRQHLPRAGLVLEIASGTGEHAVHLAQHLGPDLVFQPSDPSEEARASIDAWVDAVQLPNLRRSLALDACAETWPIEQVSAVLCINMIHISPWQAAVGLVLGAARVLEPSGLLILYGPYKRGGAHTAPSNDAFDQDLRRRNAEWGVRDLEDVAILAASHGFSAPIIHDMPANNLTVLFKRTL